jgi:hypothetical protein
LTSSTTPWASADSLDTTEKYGDLAIRSKDRGERETYECIVELYVEIAEELERRPDAGIDRRGCWDIIAVTKVGGGRLL